MGRKADMRMSQSENSNSSDGSTPPGGGPSIHDSLQQQIMQLIDDAGLSEEEKQQILVGIQCPCCGAGGLSLSIKLKSGPRSTPSF